MNTSLKYVYIDDSNYEKYGSILLSGEVSDSDRTAITSRLDSGEMFVAEQVGLPSLRERWLATETSPSFDDNGWHWLVEMTATPADESIIMPASELVARFKAVEIWRPMAVLDCD